MDFTLAKESAELLRATLGDGRVVVRHVTRGKHAGKPAELELAVAFALRCLHHDSATPAPGSITSELAAYERAGEWDASFRLIQRVHEGGGGTLQV